MFNKLTIVIALLAMVFFSTQANAVTYTGPKMDLSKYQPEFRVGFLGDEAAQDIIAINDCFMPYIEAAYNVPAKFFTFKDYAGTMESMLGGNLDYTWFGSSGYAGMSLNDPTAFVPVFTSMQPTGHMGYYSVSVATTSSGITSMADLTCHSFCCADPNSTSACLLPYL